EFPVHQLQHSRLRPGLLRIDDPGREFCFVWHNDGHRRLRPAGLQGDKAGAVRGNKEGRIEVIELRGVTKHYRLSGDVLVRAVEDEAWGRRREGGLASRDGGTL